MASLYKRKKVVVDPRTGEKRTKMSAKWWARYRDENGRLRRKSLSTSKNAARKMLTDILTKVERLRAGLDDPTDEARQWPIDRHIDDFELHQKSKNNTSGYVKEIVGKLRRCVDHCDWQTIQEISAFGVERFLVHLREKEGLSIQTSNHYLKGIKCFVRWLARERRLPHNPLDGVSTLNVATDRRHDRRSFQPEEFARVYRVAKDGPPSVGLCGPDRAMLYMLAAYTGLRRGELGSLTIRNLDLEASPPTIKVEASYSKHRRDDVVYLHPEIVPEFKDWLESKSPQPDQILFEVVERTCGVDRRTSEMLEFDLKSARCIWIAEAEDEEEKQKREASDFLKYKDSCGLYADFHSLRHTFVTNLARAKVSPKIAQSLARHSDIRLTMNLYTHVDQDEQVTAIESLPGLMK